MDLSVAYTLKDSNEIIDIEKPFKLVAGPGAGKTTFLVNHIKNILMHSKRLSKTRKIACITYTNIGVETIISRLKDSLDNIEVGTIHNFLYKNIVKPYLWVLDEKYEFNHKNIDGHDEIIPTYSILEEFKKEAKAYMFKDSKLLTCALTKLRWVLDNEEIKLKCDFYKQDNGVTYNINNKKALIYKKICWKLGMIDHDDILFLSYEIINEKPEILDILRAKFPYLLIDEFQDTNPIQTYIVSQIAEKETIVGVIGDEWQSIYSFQGAKLSDFENFDLKNMVLYKLEDNHRSTTQIIDVLNDIRNDESFKQKSCECRSGDKPYIIIGNFFYAYDKAKEICKEEKLYTLTYKNKMSNILKYKFEDESTETPEELLNTIRTFDNQRGKMILEIIYGIEYCKQNKIKEGIKHIKRAYRKVDDFGDKEALSVLNNILPNYDKFVKENIKKFYMNNIHNLPYTRESKIQRGKKDDFYSNLLYKNVSLAIKLDEDSEVLYKTIHKSKGDEFDNVLIVISDKFNEIRECNLEFLLNPNKECENDRLYYVALSRAKNKLFINIPNLSEENKSKLLDRFNII